MADPVEKIVSRNGEDIKATLITYKTQDNQSTGVAVPFREYSIESNTPFSKDNTMIAENSSGVYELQFDSKYNVKTEFSYDPYCNLISYFKTDDIPISYFYGYNSTLEVVEAKNVSYSQLNAAIGNLQSSFDMFLLSLGDLSNATERGNWKNFNLSLRSSLPQDARIITYTYKPLIGMTSKTDENGMTTYLSYDKLGRLVSEKDNDYNIVKSYQYHFQGQ